MTARDLPWRKWMPLLVYVSGVLVVLAILFPLILSARDAARRASSKNNLKQLGLSLHNYHDVHRCFPPGGIFTEDGTPMHGWMSFDMPFIDANHAYDRLNFDEPWDDPFNLAIFTMKAEVFLNPQIESVQTRQGFGLLHYPGNAALFPPNGSVTIGDISPGLSNVWLCSETFEKWQPWGSPYNWHQLSWAPPVAERESGWKGGGAHLLMADGSVRFVNADANQEQTFRDMLGWKPDLQVPQIEHDVPRWDYEPAGRLSDTIALYYVDYEDVPEVTSEDLKAAVAANPTARVLIAEGLALSGNTLPLVTQLKNLESLYMGMIVLSEEQLQQLAELKSLKLLVAATDEQTATRLRELLPGCELRLHLVEEDDREF